MECAQVLALLAERKPVFAESFGVRRLALFGSMARGTARRNSDVDVLVAFDRGPDPDLHFGTTRVPSASLTTSGS